MSKEDGTVISDLTFHECLGRDHPYSFFPGFL